MESSFETQITDGCKALEIDIDEAGLERLYLYFKELQRWSKKINLIAKSSDEKKIIETHFLDSLLLLKCFQSEDIHLLDVGTGAGFPGLVCKAVRPNMKLSLVEPRIKRVSFLRHIVRSLKLDDVHVSVARIEDEESLASDSEITHITSRAVSEIGLFCNMIERFTCPGIRVVCMKGPKWEQELLEAESKYGIVIDNITTEKSHLPWSKALRVQVIFRLDSVNKN